jgi:hypothetical protein
MGFCFYFLLFCHGCLLRLQEVKFLTVRGRVDEVGGQIAAAIEITRAIGLPLAQGQRDIGALQQCP